MPEQPDRPPPPGRLRPVPVQVPGEAPVKRHNWVVLRRPVVAVFAVAAVLLTRPVLPLFVAGAAVVAVALALRVWARGCLRKNLELTTAGPYRLSRNPLYLANLAMILGLLLIAGNLWLGLAAGAALPPVFWYLVVRFEERRLAAQFGPEYSAYCQAVPRLLSFRVFRRRAPAVPVTGAFSWRRAAGEWFCATGLALWISVAGAIGLGADRPMVFELFALARKALGI